MVDARVNDERRREPGIGDPVGAVVEVPGNVVAYPPHCERRRPANVKRVEADCV